MGTHIPTIFGIVGNHAALFILKPIINVFNGKRLTVPAYESAIKGCLPDTPIDGALAGLFLDIKKQNIDCIC